MTDPIMDFFDDAHLFEETLGLSDDAFVQHGSVSLADELNLGAEFEPLSVDSLNHVRDSQTHHKINEFDALNQYDSIKLHQVNQSYNSPVGSVLSPQSQFSCSPIRPPNQGSGIFPEDGSPMWGHQTSTSIPSQNGSPFHQHGHSQTIQQSKGYVTHDDFTLYQANEQQTPQCPINSISVGPETLNQPKNFMDVNVSVPLSIGNAQQPQLGNTATSQQSLPVQQFSQPTAATLHFCGNPLGVQHESTFESHSPTLTPCSVDATQPFSTQYSFSNNQLNHTTPSLPELTGNSAFSDIGTKHETNQGMMNPNAELHSNNFQVVQSSHAHGNFNRTKMSPETINFTHPDGSSTQMRHFNDHIENNGFSPLEDTLLQHVDAQTEHFSGLDPEDLLQEDLLKHFDEPSFSQEDANSSSNILEHQDMKITFARTQIKLQNDILGSQPHNNHHPWHLSDSNHHLPQEEKQHCTFQGKPPSSKKTDGFRAFQRLANIKVRSASDKRPKKKVDTESKQEKANRIISEAIAKAKERGERNIPRVMSPENFPSVSSEGKDEKRGRKGKSKPKEKEGKKTKAGLSSELKEKKKIGKLIITLGRKQKRKMESSDDVSDSDRAPRVHNDEDLQEFAWRTDHLHQDQTGSMKRRSNRQVKRKKYVEDVEGKQSEDEPKANVKPKKNSTSLPVEQPLQLFVENPSEEDAAIVDKILASRIAKKETSSGTFVEVEEYYVKYKNYSYLHCEWATEQQLLKDKRIHQKIKRFKIRQAQRAHFFADMEEELFNSDYIEVDRVLEVSLCQDKDTGEPVIYYLVKWCSLPYEDSTWELKEDVDQAKIDEFEQLQALKPDARRVERPPPNSWKKINQSREYKIGNQLREYQLEGLNWLLFNWYNRRNCILADEMGLGKTIQSITFLQEIYLNRIPGPFLIIAPLSTIANWEREFRTWTDLNVVVYHGSMISRQMIQQYEMYFRDSQGRIIWGSYKFHAIITTFEMILGGCPELNAIEWRCVIFDEAHRLKNKNCKLLEGLKLMNLEHKVLLTGTPLQNTVEELFSLLHFLEPQRFPSESTFMQEFGDLKTEEQVQKLQAILKPMMLRRLKEDVEKKLAPKEETIIEVELTNIQKKYYRAILEKNFAFLSKGAGQANVPNLVNTMMELRKCCNHPYLIKGAEEKILGEFRETYNQMAADFYLQAMIQSAGKLVLIDKLLPKMKAGGHKVLIFSQMVRCLDILEDYLMHKRYLYERIDGRVRGNLRQAAIDRFSKPDSDRFVFLLCTRAGGLGINLTAADTCIIFDSDWNPQNDLQAQARCHRIGQNKAVKVYRLITRNSYEREMFDRASLKLGLDKAVLQSMSGRENSVGGIQQLSKKEIEDLLRRGAYGAIMDEEDEGSKFCEEDIDQILQRRTKTITIESEGRGSTFAKASFVASGNRTDISLDDPNFWQKWAKKAEIDIDSVSGRNSLVIDTPRIRKQTRPFSATKDELAELSEAESEGEDKPKLRRPYDRANGYGRTECFRVEKNLLVYGWGRWRDILSHGRFKRQLNEQDVEIICRALLAYCLVHYRGDEKIKSFIWDLITPTEDGRTRELQNHLGLSAPVPRGRKGKKVKTQTSTFDIHKAEWLRKHNPEHLLQDDGYKKHLKHHCNKVLLRVRMLYYLRQEVIGVYCQKVLDGVASSEIDLWVPEPDHSELPVDWWDTEADKSLLIGVFKHGYEKYNTIRADPALCFLERAGKPDEKAVAAEQRANDFIDGDVEDPEYKPAPTLFKDDMKDDDASPGDLIIADGDGQIMDGDKVYWPTQSALTTRLRRLVTAFQRTSKCKQVQLVTPVFPVQAAATHAPNEEATLNPKMAAKIERQQRWTRREEADFYRVVSTFGVVFDPGRGQFDWTKFRAMARLHKKTDESLEKYLYAFIAMCRRVCRLPSRDEFVDSSISIQPITEERASRTLYRIELLRKVREQALRHPQLFERLKLCQPNPDLPVWWECGTHDRDLLIGAAKHGVSRTDYHILRDPELSFMVTQKNYSQSKGTSSTPLLAIPNHLSITAFPLHSHSKVQDVKGFTNDDIRVKEEALKEDILTSEEESASSERLKARRKIESLNPTIGPVFHAKEQKAVVKIETNRRMVAARTEPLTPNLTSKKQRISKHESASSSDSDSDSNRSSCSSRSSSSSTSSSSCSHSGSSSSSSSSSSCSSSTSSSSSSSSSSTSSSEDSDDGDAQKSAESVPHVKTYDEESVASVSTLQDETQDSFQMDNGTPNSSCFLPGGYMLAGAHWPKDRVMINRLDSICQAVLKGKWPTTRRNYEATSVASFYATKLLDSPGAATEYSEAGQQAPSCLSVKEEPDHLQMSKEGGLKLTFQKQGVPQKRPLDCEEGLGQQQYLARLQDLQNASESSLVNFPKSSTASGTLCTSSAVYTNGALPGTQPVNKKRRGRRKNVEGVDHLFTNQNKMLNHVSEVLASTFPQPAPCSQALSSTKVQWVQDADNPVPVINLKDGTRLAGDDAPKRKDLENWLKEHPGYVEDLGAFIPRVQFHDGRPKQKRHRCRNPSKLDVNSLTGEERVQLINRRNARKVGGAFAPPLKDLCKFLKENPEYGVAPEWGDVVKQSGFLPDSMFDRILTGPVVREEVSRRGRRPKSETAKAAVATTVANSDSVNQLLGNSLIPGVDLSSYQALQQNFQSLQSLQLTAGLIGLPAGLSASGGDSKNLTAMLPMLLSSMAGLPSLLGMGHLLNKSSELSTDGKEKNCTSGLKEGDGNKERTVSPSDDKANQNTSPPSTSTGMAVTAGSLALNPLLLPNIIYPGMLLTPGLNLHIPAVPQSNLYDVQNASNENCRAQNTDVTAELPVPSQEEKPGKELCSQNENSTDEGSEKADPSSGSNSPSSSSSSSEDSDSSDDD
ncbi:chromodomain-helicase-DNA-binding protein 9 isoform X4 [Xenopus tropicalis]|uniref:Chromodomain-helicase-DNA-binding protein 9 isoform X4 n=1 Tax=Xenopus tropicalis TaxID=8364 RepID=A0A8J1JG92_XENTR|nr:chromodomain-helicase-DNA-binding protein 9 isoform X4 [Xenopus tropicalis]